MPLNLSNVHIDTFLSNFSVQYTPPMGIAEALFPKVPVDKQTNAYPIWGRDNFRAPETARAPKTEARRVEFSVSSDTYNCVNHALATEIPLEVNANASTVIALKQGATRGLKDNFHQSWERRVANVVTSTSNVGSNMTKTTSTTLQWNDYINSDPIGDVEIAKESIRSVSGVMANTMVISQNVWRFLRRHPQIVGTKYPHGGGIVSVKDVIDIFEVENVLLGAAIENTANQSPTFDTFTGSSMWGNYVFLAYVTKTPGIGVQTYGATFQWKPDGFPSPEVIASNVENKAGGKYIETLEMISFLDEKTVASRLGFLIVDAVA